MRKLGAILSSLVLAGLLAGCIVVDRPYHHDGYYYGGPGYYWHDRD